MNVLSVVASFFRDGGPFMFIILLIGVMIVAVVLERMMVVGRSAAINGRKTEIKIDVDALRSMEFGQS